MPIRPIQNRPARNLVRKTRAAMPVRAAGAGAVAVVDAAARTAKLRTERRLAGTGDEDDADEEEGQAHEDQADDDRGALETSAHTSARSEEAEDQGEAEGRRRGAVAGGRRNRRGPDDAVSRSDAANDDGRRMVPNRTLRLMTASCACSDKRRQRSGRGCSRTRPDAAAAQPEAPEEPKSARVVGPAGRRRNRHDGTDSVAEGDWYARAGIRRGGRRRSQAQEKARSGKTPRHPPQGAKPDDTAVCGGTCGG